MFESFLCMGITISVFKTVGYIAEGKERLKISTKYVEITFFSNFSILVGILFGPEDLLSLSEDRIDINSSMYVRLIKK